MKPGHPPASNEFLEKGIAFALFDPEDQTAITYGRVEVEVECGLYVVFKIGSIMTNKREERRKGKTSTCLSFGILNHMVRVTNRMSKELLLCCIFFLVVFSVTNKYGNLFVLRSNVIVTVNYKNFPIFQQTNEQTYKRTPRKENCCTRNWQTDKY